MLFLNRTKTGLGMRAVAINRDIALVFGVNANRMNNLALGIGAGIAAAGGVLIAPILYVTPQLGASVGISGFAAAILGGLGNLPGAIVGGLGIRRLPERRFRLSACLRQRHRLRHLRAGPAHPTHGGSSASGSSKSCDQRWRVGLLAQGVVLVLLFLLPSLVNLSGYQLHIIDLILLTIPLGIGLAHQHGALWADQSRPGGAVRGGRIHRRDPHLAGRGPPMAGDVAGALAGGVIGMVVGLPSLRIRGHYLAIATLGLAVAAETIFTAGGELTGGPLGIGRIPVLPGIDTSEGRDAGYYPLLLGVACRRWIFARMLICGPDRFGLRSHSRRPSRRQGHRGERGNIPAAGVHDQRPDGWARGFALRDVERIHQPRFVPAGPDVLPADDPGRRRHAESAGSGRRNDRPDRCVRERFQQFEAYQLIIYGSLVIVVMLVAPGRPGRLGQSTQEVHRQAHGESRSAAAAPGLDPALSIDRERD